MFRSSPRSLGALVVAAALLAAPACSADPATRGAGGAPPGADPAPPTDPPATGADAPGAPAGGPGASSPTGPAGDLTPPPTCTATGFPVAGIPPNVLIVLDRSCSMRRRVDDRTQFADGPEDPRGRWFQAREAIRRLTERFPAQVRWGLVTFPTVGGCDVATEALVDPAALSGAAVMEALERRDTAPFRGCNGGSQAGGTPTEEALDAALALPAMHDATRESFAIVVTDGGANCGASEDSLRAMTDHLREAGISTAVVGFGDETTQPAARTLLDAIAANGGMPREGGPPFYYQADDGDSLAAVLETIAVAAISCSLHLEGAPPDSAGLNVALDGDAVPGTEWSYDAASSSVTLSGAACDRLKTGAVTRVDVAWGCGGMASGDGSPGFCTPGAEVCDGLDNDCDGVADDDCLF